MDLLPATTSDGEWILIIAHIGAFQLAGSLLSFRWCDEVYEGLRVYPSGKHLIFYFATDKGTDIIRVLHERMDIPSHL